MSNFAKTTTTTTVTPQTKGYCRGDPLTTYQSQPTKGGLGGQQTRLKSPAQAHWFFSVYGYCDGLNAVPTRDVAVLTPRTPAYNLIGKQGLCRWPSEDEAITVGSDPIRLALSGTGITLPQAELGENPGTSLPGASSRSLALLTP